MAEPSDILFSRYGPGQTLQQTVHLRGVSSNRPQLRREIACAHLQSPCPQYHNKPAYGCRGANMLCSNTFVATSAVQSAKCCLRTGRSGARVLLRLMQCCGNCAGSYLPAYPSSMCPGQHTRNATALRQRRAFAARSPCNLRQTPWQRLPTASRLGHPAAGDRPQCCLWGMRKCMQDSITYHTPYLKVSTGTARAPFPSKQIHQEHAFGM